MTPGTMFSATHGSRAVGMTSSVSRLMTAPVVVFFVSTTGDAAVTLITSSRVETSSFVFTSAVKPVSMMIPARLTVLNPESWNVIVYVPMGTCTN